MPAAGLFCVMKFLKNLPPSRVAGRVRQGGRQGSFVRSGPPPVQPRTPAVLATRAAFSASTTDYPELPNCAKKSWRAWQHYTMPGTAARVKSVVPPWPIPVPIYAPGFSGPPEFVSVTGFYIGGPVFGRWRYDGPDYFLVSSSYYGQGFSPEFPSDREPLYTVTPRYETGEFEHQYNVFDLFYPDRYCYLSVTSYSGSVPFCTEFVVAWPV